MNASGNKTVVLMAERLISYRHTFINSVGTFFSRITGIVKQPLISYLFGSAADPFVLAFRIANTLRRYIGEGALSNSFIPVFRKQLEKGGEKKAHLFAGNIINLFLLITSLLTVLGIVLAPFYFPPLVLGFKPGSPELEQSVRLVMIMMPFTIFISLYSIGMGILNTYKRFASPAFAPVLFNIAFIMSPILFGKQLGIYSLALGVVAGGALMFIAEFFELFQIRFHYKPVLNFKDEGMKDFFKLFLPTSANMLVLTVKNLATTQFLSFFKGASLIFLNVITLIEAPIGIIGIAIGTVLLPMLSKYNADKDKVRFEKSLAESFSMLFYFIVPISFFFVFYPDTVINCFFRDTMRLFTGNLGKYGDLLVKTYTATSVYSIALIPMACIVLFERIFYSTHDAKTPLRANTVVFIFSFALYFSSFIPQIGFLGVFLADMIAAWMTFVYYYIKLKKLTDIRALRKDLLPRILLYLLFSAVSAAAVLPFHRLVYIKDYAPLTAILLGALEFCLFAAVFYALTKLFKVGLKKHE